MIKNWKKFNESLDNTILYYSFDWDDNILNMPTKIFMERKEGDKWIPEAVSTSKFAEVRTDTVNYRLANDAFSNFRDNGPRGIESFKLDVIESIKNNEYGPAWDDFIECLTNGSIFSIITARGHEYEGMRLGIDWILDNILSEDELNEMYNNLRKYEYLFDNEKDSERILKGKPSKNPIIKRYLENCDFIGVSSPSREGSAENPEEAKKKAFLEFNKKINNFASRIGMKAKIGFSDDDLGNVNTMTDLINNLNHEEFANIIEYNIKNTNDPNDVKKTRVEINELDHQAPGTESSISPFTQFGNMTNHLYNNSKDIRQDDESRFFRRKAEYLTKNSLNLFKQNENLKGNRDYLNITENDIELIENENPKLSNIPLPNMSYFNVLINGEIENDIDFKIQEKIISGYRLYQPHIFIHPDIRGFNLTYKIYLKFISEFGNLYFSKGRQVNNEEIETIHNKLKQHPNITVHKITEGSEVLIWNAE